jgi:CheY-like chemotaxis protein
MEYQMRVLIIEDSAVLQRLIETCFRDYGAEFQTQRLPHSAQRLGGFLEADLVVIGMYQPFTIGFGIIERLRSRANPPAIIAITTDTREKSIRAIDEAGVDAVVKMPFRPDDLRRAADSAMANRS